MANCPNDYHRQKARKPLDVEGLIAKWHDEASSRLSKSNGSAHVLALSMLGDDLARALRHLSAEKAQAEQNTQEAFSAWNTENELRRDAEEDRDALRAERDRLRAALTRAQFHHFPVGPPTDPLVCTRCVGCGRLDDEGCAEGCYIDAALSPSGDTETT